jgi:hypothetical protein
MLSRSVAIAAMICASGSWAAAEDPRKAPCEIMAQYLRDYARDHPNEPVDTGNFEFLRGAAHVGGDRDLVPPPDAEVTAIGMRSFDSIDAAVQAVGNVDLADGARQSLAFRVEGALLVPTSLPDDGGGERCWTLGLTALRIGQNAFPAVWEVASEPADLAYSISLLNAEGSVLSQQKAFCRVNISFQPTLHIVSWYPAKGADVAFLSKLRATLEPMLTRDDADQWAAHAKALRPEPRGDDPYDRLLRVATDNSQELLHAIDPTSLMAELPNVEQESYSSWGPSDFIPQPDLMQLGHHRLLVITGQPTLGWRTWPDLAFAVWEWTGAEVIPVVSGYLAKKATSPTIQAE